MPGRYRNCTITFDPPPIPSRDHDWAWVSDEYTGPPDPRCGTGASIDDVIRQINEVLGCSEPTPASASAPRAAPGADTTATRER